MRVPVVNLPGVLPAGGAPNLRVETPGGFQVLERGAAAVGQAADQIQAGIEKEQHEAAVVEARDNLTQYERETTDTLHGASKPTSQEAGDAAFAGRDVKTGFLSVKGKEAAAQSADTLDELEQTRQRRAAAITDKKARELFLQSSAAAYEQTRRTVESHVSQQIEQAKVDSIAAASDEAVRAAALEPGNDNLARERIASVAGAISGLGRGQEFNDTQTLQVQQRVATTRLDALLGKHDVAGAERVLEANKWALGAQLDDYTKAVNLEREKQGADGLALELVDGARQPNGFIDTAQAIESLQALPKEKRTPQVEEAFGKWLRLEGEKQKAVTEQYFNKGLSAFLERHNLADVSPTDELWLKNPKNDPQGWYKLEQIAKAHHEGGPATPGQRVAMTRFLVDVADHPDKYATMSVGEFNHTWLPKLSSSDATHAGAVLAQMHTKAGKPEDLSPIESRMLLQKGREARVFDAKQNDVSKWSDEQAQNYYVARELLAEQIATEKRVTGKSPDMKTIEGWVDKLLLSGKNAEGGFLGFGGNTTRLEAEAQGTLGSFKPKWTLDEKASAIEALRKGGARIDDAAVDRILRLKHGLPALPTQAAPAKSPDEVDPGRWGLDLSPPAPVPDREVRGKL